MRDWATAKALDYFIMYPAPLIVFISKMSEKWLQKYCNRKYFCNRSWIACWVLVYSSTPLRPLIGTHCVCLFPVRPSGAAGVGGPPHVRPGCPDGGEADRAPGQRRPGGGGTAPAGGAGSCGGPQHPCTWWVSQQYSQWLINIYRPRPWQYTVVFFQCRVWCCLPWIDRSASSESIFWAGSITNF